MYERVYIVLLEFLVRNDYVDVGRDDISRLFLLKMVVVLLLGLSIEWNVG